MPNITQVEKLVEQVGAEHFKNKMQATPVTLERFVSTELSSNPIDPADGGIVRAFTSLRYDYAEAQELLMLALDAGLDATLVTSYHQAQLHQGRSPGNLQWSLMIEGAQSLDALRAAGASIPTDHARRMQSMHPFSLN